MWPIAPNYDLVATAGAGALDGLTPDPQQGPVDAPPREGSQAAIAAGAYNRVVPINDLTVLPGGDLVVTGLRDLRAGVESIEAALVRIGASNLRERGIEVPSWAATGSPEHALYGLLARRHGLAAHSQYNALLRRLVSFERALQCGSR